MAQMLDLADLVGGESKAAIINTFKEPNESNLSFFFSWSNHATFGILVPKQRSSLCFLHWKNGVKFQENIILMKEQLRKPRREMETIF